MQHGREWGEWLPLTGVMALRSPRGHQPGERCGRRHGQRDARQGRGLGWHIGLVVLRRWARIGCRGVEAPLRRRPPSGSPCWLHRASRLGKPGPAQGTGQRVRVIAAPWGEERPDPGAGGQLGQHRCAARDQPRPPGRCARGLQPRIGGEPPKTIRGRGAAPGRTRARGPQPGLRPLAKPDAQFGLSAAQQRQRQARRPECGWQGRGIPAHADRHPTHQRIERLGRAHRRAPADIAERPSQGQPAIGARCRHRCRGQQPQDPTRTTGHSRSLDHAPPPSPSALWANHAR